MQQYWRQYFDNLRRNEQRSMLPEILKNHPQISRYLRAHLIDWLYHVCQVLPKEDQTLPFIAVNIMDRYFSKVKDRSLESSQVQLTGLAALFMVSKFLEIVPLFLQDVVRDMAYNKYNARQIVDKETELMSLLACDIDPPNHFDAALVYFKYIRMQIYTFQAVISLKCLAYIESIEKYASDFCRMALTDIELMALRPSILGAYAIHFGIMSVEKFSSNLSDPRDSNEDLK